MECPKRKAATQPKEVAADTTREPTWQAEPGMEPSVQPPTGTAALAGPAIIVTKNAPSQVTVGKSFSYEIVVTNKSQDAEVENVVVSDPMPEGLAFESSTPAGEASGNTVTWKLGSLAPGASKSITVQAHGTKSATNMENCSTVAATVKVSSRACVLTSFSNPQLTVRKTGPATATVCDLINYQVTVSNPGDGTATNVRVVDTLAAGVTTTDPSEWVVGNLAPGETRTFSLSARCNEVGAKLNRVTVTGDEGLTATDEVTTTVVQPVLALAKTAPADRYSGRPIPYQITVTNPGNSDVPGVIVEDAIPAGAAFQSAGNGGVLQGNTVVWNVGTLPAGQSRTLALECIATMIDGVIRNTATARGECANLIQASAETRVKSVPGILLECMDVDDPIEVGSNETYVIDVTNQGTVEDTNIVVECTLPAEQEFVSASVVAGAESPVEVKHEVSGRTVKFSPIASIAPKGRLTYKVVVKCTAAGDVRFGVKLLSDSLAAVGPVTETESTHVY